MLREGMFLQNRYEILGLIGSGGMSDVYKAKCHKLDRMVAIKVLKEDLSSDVSFVAKFKMEAQSAAGLSHPNIVSVYDVVDEGNLHYIVMELVEGVTLKSYIAKKGRLEIKEAVGIAIQVAQGIAAAHEQNIIHRDIKPQNMLISRDGKVKVADFGIARMVTAQTQGSMAIGSVHYISPEQARGGYSDARSDIYSLGITMYEMVTGHLPFEGENAVSVALAHVEEPITRPSYYNPDIPVSLENIILKCTEKRPERRYAAVTDVITDLRRVLIHPDENFVAMVPETDISDTRPITQEELMMINAGQKVYQPGVDVYERERFQESEDSAFDGVRRGIERLMTGAGIFVAVVIVAVLLVLFMRLGGLFRSGSGSNPLDSSGIQAETVAENGGESLAASEVRVPDITNLPENAAESKLREYDLYMQYSGRIESDTVEAGSIISQDPVNGTVVSRGSTISVTVSVGNGLVDLSGMALTSMGWEEAGELLEQNGLKTAFEEENNDTVAEGMIIRYEPVQARAGDTVTLYISKGPAKILRTVPDLYNISEDEAIQRLTDAGLTVGDVTREYDDTISLGCVISQDVPANSNLDEGGAVSFVVSDGPDPASGRYLAAISETFNSRGLIGPGQAFSDIRVMIRLRQDSENGPVYRTLMEPQDINGEDLLPVEFPRIEAVVPGEEYGEVEVVNASSGEVLKSYPVRFFATE